MFDRRTLARAYGRHQLGLVFAAADALAKALSGVSDSSLDDTILRAVRAETFALRAAPLETLNR